MLRAVDIFSPGDPVSAEAIRNFNEGNYEVSLRFFEQLLKKYPSDGEYRYFAGRCLLALNRNPEKAKDYLKVASIKDVPVDVYFYLGRACHLSGEFKEAVHYYKKFTEFGKGREVRELNVDDYINLAKNASVIARYGKVLNVKSYTIVDKALTFSQFGFEETGGRFIPVSKIIGDEYPVEVNENAVAFLPKDIKEGDYIYFSGHKKFSGQQDIFRIQFLADGKWGGPEVLSDVINTREDEDYPFFDATDSILYFASRGHFGMGGYDLFSSSFNKKTGEWSEPANLDFPVNSAGDDLLYIPADNGKIVWLISTRNSASGKAMIYKLDNSGPALQKGYEYPESIYEASKLGYAHGMETAPEQQAVKRDEPVAEKRSEAGFKANKTYTQLINNALRLQLKADSFLRVAQDMRYAAAKIKDDQTRFRVQKEIMANEQQAGYFQEQADDNYKQAREMEQVLSKEKRENILDRQIKEQFSSKKKHRTKSVPKEGTGSSFAIYSKSPYSSQHPFPANINLPSGVAYRIQLGVFSQPQEWDAFGGIYPVSTEPLQSKGLTKYYAGIFKTWEEAQQALLKVRNYGFKDAFIVAYYEAKKISANRARDLESYNSSR